MIRHAMRTVLGAATRFFQLNRMPCSKLLRAVGREYEAAILSVFEKGYCHARTATTMSPLDSAGNPLPWYTYPAIHFLSQFNWSASSVFEYGCGLSSLYWASRAAHVYSVESDSAWAERIRSKRVQNLHIVVRSDRAAYVDAIHECDRDFNVIVIDGRFRLSCAGVALMRLAKGGVVVLDNSDWHPRTAALLRSKGLAQIDFAGFGPVNCYTWVTSVFFAPSSSIWCSAGRQTVVPIGGLDQVANEE